MTSLRIKRAGSQGLGVDLKVVLDLIDEARNWLPRKDADQWSKPWPDEDQRDQRVLRSLENGETWIVWNGETPAATVTAARHPDLEVWAEAECDPCDEAVYLHRLITARSYAGLGLGAQLIDWAGMHGCNEYGAEWVRINVWSANQALQNYYKEAGFEPCGSCPDSGYPSGVLFQKPVSEISLPSVPLIAEVCDSPALVPKRDVPAEGWQNGRLDAGRQLRNRTVHGESQQLWTPAMAESVIAASHEAVASLYPDTNTSAPQV